MIEISYNISSKIFLIGTDRGISVVLTVGRKQSTQRIPTCPTRWPDTTSHADPENLTQVAFLRGQSIYLSAIQTAYYMERFTNLRVMSYFVMLCHTLISGITPNVLQMFHNQSTIKPWRKQVCELQSAICSFLCFFWWVKLLRSFLCIFLHFPVTAVASLCILSVLHNSSVEVV